MTNPVFKMEERNAERDRVLNADSIMTINGTIQITAFMGLILVMAAGFVWQKFAMGHTDMGMMLMSIGGIVGFISALIIAFARTTFLVPVYAICEALFLGGISASFEASYPGIVAQAVVGTFAAFFSMLLLYKMNLIRCTDKFRSVIFISTASIAVIYIVNFIGSFFNYAVPIINTATNAGIGFSLIVVAIAALNLIIDFDFIEKGAQNMYPKKYEWYGAFGLMVTLVWLYFEILKLLAKFSSRD
jgi:uncharacterized YccA/Bax inhibitor family protein